VAYLEKKPGHLVNLGELIGPETYNLLCVALSIKFLKDILLFFVQILTEFGFNRVKKLALKLWRFRHPMKCINVNVQTSWVASFINNDSVTV